MRFFLSAGEASGDNYGAALIETLRQRAPQAEFFGLGGERMREAGCKLVINASDVAFVGLTEVVAHLPGIYRKYRELVRSIDEHKPDIAVVIDFPEINLRLAREFHKRGIPCVYFVSPQLWAWKKGRIRNVKEHVSRMLVIFPFEEPFYRERGVQAEYVGHPLADLPQPAISRENFAMKFDLDPAKQWIALLPGSRRSEVGFNLRTMVQAAEQLGRQYEFILPVASTLNSTWISAQMPSGNGVRITMVEDARAAMKHARASVVASGTATVEAALIGNPFVVVYRLSRLTYAMLRRMVKLHLPYVAMANLIAGKQVVPELLQENFTAETVVAHLQPLLSESPERSAMMQGLAEVRTRLHVSGSETAIERAAEAVWNLVTNQPQARQNS